jgi:DNA polymerase III delta prime subunit
MDTNAEQFAISGNVFLIAGSADNISQVFTLLKESGIETETNPDLYARNYRQFGIDDAHELRARASARAIGDRRVFIISASGMTSEAQNALLKTLEEPPANALFIFLVPAPEMLLATVRSRSQILKLKDNTGSVMKDTKSKIDLKVFFVSAPAKRIEMLKVILEKDNDDKYDTGAILGFLSSLEQFASQIKNREIMDDTLHTIYRARQYIADRGALIKVLLESVALLLPQV